MTTVLSVFVDLNEALSLRERFGTEAGVGVHLSATGLLGVEIKIDPQSLKQPHHSPTGLGKQSVVIAGDKQRRAHTLHHFGRATRKGMVFDRDTNCLLQSSYLLT